MASMPILFTVEFRRKMAELSGQERHAWLASLVAREPAARSSSFAQELREVARGCRLPLVDQIQARLGPFDPLHLRALLEVERERFVIPDDVVRSAEDIPLPLDDVGLATISAPHAYLLSYRLLGLAPGDQLVELGTGSGYGSALAAFIVGGEGLVTTFEIDSSLAQRAQSLLAGMPNVTTLAIRRNGERRTVARAQSRPHFRNRARCRRQRPDANLPRPASSSLQSAPPRNRPAAPTRCSHATMEGLRRANTAPFGTCATGPRAETASASLSPCGPARPCRHGFAREFVGSLVQRHPLMPRHVDELRPAPLHDFLCLRHKIAVGFCLPAFLQDSYRVLAVGVHHEGHGVDGGPFDGAKNSGELGDVVRGLA